MKSVKFLHCADIHLDAPFTSLGGDKGKSSIRRLDLLETFGRIIDTAEKEKVDIILICGDLYEHSYVRKSTINFINGRFDGIPEIKIFIIPGNHDPYITNSYYNSFKWSKNVYILDQQKPYEKLADLETCIYGFGFNGFYQEGTDLDRLKITSEDYINIFLTHGTVDMNIGQNQYNSQTSKDLSSLGMDYIALGHFHNRIDSLGGYGNIYNPGSPEPLGFDETAGHGVYIGSITKDDDNNRQLDVRFIELNKRFYHNTDIDVSGCSSDQQVINRIREVLGNKNTEKDIFKIVLKGRVEQGFIINTGFIYNSFSSDLFFLKLVNESEEDYNLLEIAKEPGLKGIFTRRMLALVDNSQDNHQKQLLMKSLYYGIEAMEKGKVELMDLYIE